MKITNTGSKPIGFGKDFRLLPEESKTLPSIYENHPLLPVFEKQGFIRLDKGTAKDEAPSNDESPAKDEDLSKLTYKELQTKAKELGVSASGSSEEIIARIQEKSEDN